MRLMLVDDESLAIEGLLENIKGFGYPFECILTASGKDEALQILSKNRVDMMVCDIEMPGGSGLELVEQINALYPEVISVILSCHDEFYYAQRAVRLACFDYILKPATPAAIYPVLERALARMGAVESMDTDESSSIAETVRAYIDAHLTDDLTVQRLASLYFMSPDHLTRCFRRRYRTTISEYIMDKRLELAARMLGETNISVTMAAAKAGYPNYAYFSKIFKKKYGIPPVKYRGGKN